MDSAPITLMNGADLVLILPAIVVGIAAVGVLLVDLVVGERARPALPYLAAGGLALAFGALNLFAGAGASSGGASAFYGCLHFDPMVFLAHNVILGLSLFLILVSPLYLEGRPIPQGEYYALMLFSTLAMLVLAASSELLTLFLNIEMLSFTLYILTGIERKNLRSTEAAFKYFLTGSYAAAFLLLGLTMVFGATGSTHFGEILAKIHGNPSGARPIVEHPLFLAGGFSLMLVGFGFKLTLAPFHMYAPDVYAGAPTPVAGAIATGSKVATLVAFFQVFRLIAAWENLPHGIYIAFYSLTVLSLALGNLGALLQPNVKRLLAYSGVAHSGYVLIPLVAALARRDLLESAERAISYYLVAYSLMTVLAFGVAATLGPLGESHLDRYGGLARRSPFLAAALGLSMLSLTGIPATVGFMGKFYLFSVAVDARLYELAVFGVLASVASAYYYLRVIVKMFMEEAPVKAEPVPLESLNTLALLAASAGVFLFAIFPAAAFLK